MCSDRGKLRNVAQTNDASVRRGKRPQKRIELPKGWWLCLNDLCRARWRHPGTAFNIYKFVRMSKRSLSNARQTNSMTEQMFAELTEDVGYEDHRDLLHALAEEQKPARLVTPVPVQLSLSTQPRNPQWADYRDYHVTAPRPWALSCSIETESPYFRFGFKLLGEDGRVFGDGSIQSLDPNMVVHIGRNNWDRPARGITAQDVFLTHYMCGVVGGHDQLLFRSPQRLAASVELTVDKSFCARLAVNAEVVFHEIVPPTVCRRVVVYAWGDREEFRVDVANLQLLSLTVSDDGKAPTDRRLRRGTR